jgi:hypothetical protein
MPLFSESFVFNNLGNCVAIGNHLSIGIPYGIYDTQAAALCFWELPTKLPPSPPPAFAGGGK